MSKPISVNQLRKNLEGKGKEIDLMLRVLPEFIKREVESTNNLKVLKGLSARLKMVTELKKEMK